MNVTSFISPFFLAGFLSVSTAVSADVIVYAADVAADTVIMAAMVRMMVFFIVCYKFKILFIQMIIYKRFIDSSERPHQPFFHKVKRKPI